MFKRALQLLLVAGLAASALWAANDPFVGQWKLTKYRDVMKVTNVGGNKYTFSDDGSGPETIVADGTDQPGIDGTTFSFTVEGPDTWKVVRKKDVRLLISAIWNLSEDGSTLTDHYTEFGPNGSPSTEVYVYKRTGNGAGFAGRWESMTGTMNTVLMLEVRPYQTDGLTFIIPSQKNNTSNLRLDGQDYPDVGSPTKGSAQSSRRLNTRTVEITNKLNGKVTHTQQFEISADLKTLTMTVHTTGKDEPVVYIFERQ